MRTGKLAGQLKARDRRLSLGRFDSEPPRAARASAQAAVEWLRNRLIWERTLEALRAGRAAAVTRGQAA